MMSVKQLRDNLDLLLSNGIVDGDKDIECDFPDESALVSTLGIIGLSIYNDGSIELKLWYRDKEDD